VSIERGGVVIPPDRRLLREIRSSYRGMKDYQLQAGQWVQWFRFDKLDTTSDPVYSTGPGRIWYPPVTVPVMIGEYNRAPRNFDDDGLYQVDHVHGIINYFAFFSSGMVDPDPNAQDHVNDRVAFDGHLFEISSFLPRGRVGSYFYTISVDMIEIGLAELEEDPAVAMFLPYLITG
jgi:hypothetical protein